MGENGEYGPLQVYDPIEYSKDDLSFMLGEGDDLIAEEKFTWEMGGNDTLDLTFTSPEPQPHVFTGVATIDGNPVPKGSVLTADIGGSTSGETKIGEDGKYELLVAGPNSEPEITFLLEEGDTCCLVAQETAMWKQGEDDILDLTFVSPEPAEFYDPIIASLSLNGEFTDDVTGSESTYLFSESEISIKLAGYDSDDSDELHQLIIPGLVNTKDGDTHWYVRATTDPDDWLLYPQRTAIVVECQGQSVWRNDDFGDGEIDYIHHDGCMGNANDLVAPFGGYDFRVTPVAPDSWEVEVSPENEEAWQHIATFQAQPDQRVDHTKDSLAGVRQKHDVYGCWPLSVAPHPCPE